MEITNISDDDFLTPQMVGQVLHLGRTNTYKLFQLEDFPRVRIAHQYLVKRKDLYEYMDKYKGCDILL